MENPDLMNQPDGKALHEMACEVEQAYTLKQSEEGALVDDATIGPDADEAWKRFAAKHPLTEPHVVPQSAQDKASANSWQRWGIAASVLLVCMVAIAMSLPTLRNWRTATQPADAFEASTAVAAPPAEDAVMEEREGGMSFRNVPLPEVLAWVAAQHHTQVVDARTSVSDTAADQSAAAVTDEVRLYVELDYGWSLQECIALLNGFEHVNVTVNDKQQIVVR